jgi:hypothetical protein
VWSLSLITAPAQEALDASAGGEVYQHLRLEPALTPQDSLIQAFVSAARQEGERLSQRQFITATWELWMDSWWEEGVFSPSEPRRAYGSQPAASLSCWLGTLAIPLPPLQSVTSIKYQDGTGEQTWDPAKYVVEAVTLPAAPFVQKGRVYPAVGESWPSAVYGNASIKIRFVAGYGTAPSAVPALFRSAMLLLVGEAYERREVATIGMTQSKNARSAEAIFRDNRAW